MERSVFELEQALKKWRCRLQKNQTLSSAQLDELEDHLRELFAEERAGAFSPRETFRRALMRLGQAASLEKEFRGELGRSLSWWRKLLSHAPGLHELRYGIRRLLHHWAFSLSAILILALGIGANTAIFSVVNAVLLRPLPFLNPERLVRVWAVEPERESYEGAFSFPDLVDWSARSRSMTAMGLYTTLISDLVLTGEGSARELDTAYVTPGFFRTLGVMPEIGRGLLAPREDTEAREIVLSHDFWTEQFAGDETVLGRKLLLNNEPYEVVGVMPPDFQFPNGSIQIWCYLGVIPQGSAPWKLRQVRFLAAIGRLREGVTIPQAEEELGGIARQLSQEFQDANAGITAAHLEPLVQVIAGERVRDSLTVLAAAVGFILIIACANVANLVLAKGVTRRRELAVRMALGASRARVVSQLITESVLLATLSGAVGVLLAYGSIPLLVAYASEFLPRSGEIRPDSSLLGFALILSIASGILFGLAPALTASAGQPQQDLHAGGRGASEAGKWLRYGLVVSEVALAVILLVGAGLLLQSVWQRLRIDPGFEPEGLLTATLTISRSNYRQKSQYQSFYDRALERLRANPEIAGVGTLRYFPTHGVGEQIECRAVGEEAPEEGRNRTAYLLQASPNVFQVLRTPLLAGRTFLETDSGSAPVVLVINRSLALQAFSTVQAVGRFLTLQGNSLEVVGVVEDIRQVSLDEPPLPTIYVSQAQNPRRGMAFLIRSRSPDKPLESFVRDVFRDLDPNQAISEIAPASEVLRRSIAWPRLFSRLLVAFAVLAALLAVLGIYSLIAYSVNRRAREIGIRMALGADPGTTRCMVLFQGLRPVALGVVLGLAGALALSGLLRSLLFGVQAADPPTYLGVALLVALVALPACLIPAIRATRVDPVQALRQE